MEILRELKVGVHSDDGCVYAQEVIFFMRDAEISADHKWLEASPGMAGGHHPRIHAQLNTG
jgi:hypothetical protein